MTNSTLFIVASIVALFGTTGVARQSQSAPASGLWHLLPADADEQVLPQHRLDIRLYVSPAPFRAAIVNRNTNEDMPYAVAEFDGKKLRLGQRPQSPDGADSVVWLQMVWDGVRFTGGFVDDKGDPMPRTVPMKLIRGSR